MSASASDNNTNSTASSAAEGGTGGEEHPRSSSNAAATSLQAKDDSDMHLETRQPAPFGREATTPAVGSRGSGAGGASTQAASAELTAVVSEEEQRPAAAPKKTETETEAETRTGAGEADNRSKKRPRPEEFNGDPTGADAAAAEYLGDGEAGRVEVPSGDIVRAGGEDPAAAAAGGLLDVPKPLEDPRVDEVVLQDLTTKAIKRIRRKSCTEAAAMAPPKDSSVRQQAAAGGGAEPSEARQGGGAMALRWGGSSSGAMTTEAPAGATGATGAAGAAAAAAAAAAAKVMANGATPAEQRQQANGKTVGSEERKSEKGPGQRERVAVHGGSEPPVGSAGALGEGKQLLASNTAAAAAAATAAARDAGKESDGDMDAGQGGEKAKPNGAAWSASSPASKHDALPPPPPPAADSAAPCPPSPSSVREKFESSSTSGGGASRTGGWGPQSSPLNAGGAGAEATVENMEGQKEEKVADDIEGKKITEVAGAAAEAAAMTTTEVAVTRRRDSCPDHALPVARTFFDFETISGLEMRMLPEFFTGHSASKTPEMYMQSRNYIVRWYQRMLEATPDGRVFLSGTDCRRKLAGDACSILRIHDFLDRFGLINTRAGGKRPVVRPVAPPSLHLWHPNPPPKAPPSGQHCGASAGAATAALDSSRGLGTRENAASTGRGGGGGWGKAGGQWAVAQGGANKWEDEREWSREELVLLMEAAVANPNQWDAVARRVAGGRTPAECMKRFLNLAVEEVVGDGQKITAPPIPPEPAAAGFDGGADPGAGSTGTASGDGAGFGGNGEGFVDPGDQGGSSSRAVEQQQRGSWRHPRPADLGESVPALVLASKLVSNVHPEVLAAAMAAATEAADAVARRSAGTAEQGKGQVTSCGIGKSGGGRGDGEGEVVKVGGAEDRLAALAAATTVTGSGQAELSLTGGEEGVNAPAAVPASNSGQSEGGADEPRERRRNGPRVPLDAWNACAGLELAGAARAAVLSVAALQARGLAEQEERRTEALLADLLEARIQRLETRLHCFDELDQVLETERQSLEHDKAELVLQRARSMLL